MQYIIHADDFGLSKGVTDSILECFDNGALTSTSIVPNGYAFDYAIDEYKKRNGLRLSIHLDFVEGKSLLPANELNLIVNQEGKFRHSFPALLFKYLAATPKTKLRIKQQAKAEIKAQIQRVVRAVGDDHPIIIDSHCHFHIMPFIFDSIVELNDEFDIQYIRIPNEPFFLSLKPLKSISNYVGLNIIKHFVANYLTSGRRKILAERGIKTSDHFIGVLFVAGMTEQIIKSALSKIPQHDGLVEILFHPGSALESERHLFDRHFVKNYYGDWQNVERETLKSSSFRELINQPDSLHNERILHS